MPSQRSSNPTVHIGPDGKLYSESDLLFMQQREEWVIKFCRVRLAAGRPLSKVDALALHAKAFTFGVDPGLMIEATGAGWQGDDPKEASRFLLARSLGLAPQIPGRTTLP